MVETGTVDPGEVAKFADLADAWWDPDGPQRALHRLSPVRLDYIAERVAATFGRARADRRPFAGLGVVDVGCGGGLASEPMARLGAHVVGIDAAEASVAAAKAHAQAAGLSIDYRATTAEAVAAGGERFDVVLALEIVEHVRDRDAFLAALAALAAPGGLVVVSTLNRTARSYALAIVGAERVLGWLPRGTHDWSRFVTPAEMRARLQGAGLRWREARGMVFDPILWDWRLSDRDLSVNYICSAVRPR